MVISMRVVHTVKTVEDTWSVTIFTSDVTEVLVELRAVCDAIPMVFALTDSNVVAEGMVSTFVALIGLRARAASTGIVTFIAPF